MRGTGVVDAVMVTPGGPKRCATCGYDEAHPCHGPVQASNRWRFHGWSYHMFENPRAKEVAELYLEELREKRQRNPHDAWCLCVSCRPAPPVPSTERCATCGREHDDVDHMPQNVDHHPFKPVPSTERCATCGGLPLDDIHQGKLTASHDFVSIKDSYAATAEEDKQMANDPFGEIAALRAENDAARLLLDKIGADNMALRERLDRTNERADKAEAALATAKEALREIAALVLEGETMEPGISCCAWCGTFKTALGHPPECPGDIAAAALKKLEEK